MRNIEYNEIENFMLEKMKDSVHDKHHVYRVLNAALDIASHIDSIDFDVLLAGCLLHDIGRKSQLKNHNLCHAQVGGDIAYEFLLVKNWSKQKALHVKDCIYAHRYRGNNIPQSMEAKILYDADKLDVSGAIGIARTLMYEGQVSESLYILDEEENIIIDGTVEISSFFQEYNYKLKKVYESFYTDRAKEIAKERQKTAIDFYNNLFVEVTDNYVNGLKHYKKIVK